MSYVDGFVLALATKNVKRYKKVATFAKKVWLEHGAQQYVEAVGDDLKIKKLLPFTKLAGIKRGESVVFAWILFKSKAHRDRVNKKVMADPRLHESMKDCMDMFDMKRMAYGGFKVIVEGRA